MTGKQRQMTEIEPRPFGELTSYNPSLRERIGWGAADLAAALGVGRYGQQDISRAVGEFVDFIPFVGEGAGADETRRAWNRGSHIEAGLLGLGTLAGLAPIAGDFAGKGIKKLASRSVNIYAPPVKPARAFELDYPSGAKADETGRLLEDVDGRPLTAERVVGRRAVGGEDVPLLPSEHDAVTEAAIGSRPAAVEAKALPRGSVGTYVEGYSPTGDPERDVYVLKTLPPEKKDMVVAHEMGHMFDSLAREWKSDPKANIPKAARSELNFVYNDLNNPDLNMARQRGVDVERTPRKVYKGYKPEKLGYKSGPEADAELAAELGRAYLADPNYVKTVAPKAAKWWRERVNPHPLFKDIIQFNSLAAALAPVGLMGYLAERDKL